MGQSIQEWTKKDVEAISNPSVPTIIEDNTWRANIALNWAKIATHLKNVDGYLSQACI